MVIFFLVLLRHFKNACNLVRANFWDTNPSPRPPVSTHSPGETDSTCFHLLDCSSCLQESECNWNSNGICTPGCITDECFDTCENAPDAAPTEPILQQKSSGSNVRLEILYYQHLFVVSVRIEYFVHMVDSLCFWYSRLFMLRNLFYI